MWNHKTNVESCEFTLVYANSYTRTSCVCKLHKLVFHKTNVESCEFWLGTQDLQPHHLHMYVSMSCVCMRFHITLVILHTQDVDLVHMSLVNLLGFE